MLKSRNEVEAAIDTEGLPENLKRVWDSDVPRRVRHTCQDPSSLFEAFLKAPEMFPNAEELLILWQTNSDSIVGYLREQKIFIRYYLEDGPDKYQVLGKTYQQMISDLFGKLLMRNVRTSALHEVADFFEFRYLEELRDYVATNSDWEENTASFIADIE